MLVGCAQIYCWKSVPGAKVTSGSARRGVEAAAPIPINFIGVVCRATWEVLSSMLVSSSLRSTAAISLELSGRQAPLPANPNLVIEVSKCRLLVPHQGRRCCAGPVGVGPCVCALCSSHRAMPPPRHFPTSGMRCAVRLQRLAW